MKNVERTTSISYWSLSLSLYLSLFIFIDANISFVCETLSNTVYFSLANL